MDKSKHITRMIIGWVLYALIIRLMPFGSVIKGGIWYWALPHIGYYAYHPEHLKWYQPMEAK